MKRVLSIVAIMAGLCGTAHASMVRQEATPVSGLTYSVPHPDFWSAGTAVNAGQQSNALNIGLIGSVVNYYLSPFEGTAHFADGGYTSVEATATAGFNLHGDKVSFIWGSPDAYNRVAFFSGENGEGLLGTVSGSEIVPTDGMSSKYVTISGFGNFESVVFYNDDTPQNAFEFSTLQVGTVPLPASLPMFGAAVLALATVRRQSRGADASARLTG